MKHFKKLLSCVLAAALALPIAAPAALADTQDRPWINDGTASDYKGGLSEIHWGSDWGEFAKLDFTGMADKTPDELAGMFDESKFNVITTDSILSFESDEGAFYTDAESDVDLSDLDYGAGEITFPAGDTVIISSAETTLKLIGETTLNIPDDSAVMVINTYQADPQGDDMLPTVIDSRTTLNINTNTSGKLAAVGLCGGAYTSWGIAAANLNVSGKGIVAAYGGKAENQSTGVYADYSISVKGASLVGVGASGSEGSLGIMTYDMQNEDGTFSDGIVSATDDAIIIGAGGAGLSYSYGIYTANTEARNNSSIFAYGANKAEDAQDDFYSAGLVDFIKDERTRTITADNGSNICACGRGSRSTGIDERYLGDAEKPDMEFGGIRILIDDSESGNYSVCRCECL